MKKLFGLLLIVMFLSSCSTPTDKLNELKAPIILVAKSAEKDLILEPSIYSITVKDANNKLLTLSNCVEANSIGKSYSVNDSPYPVTSKWKPSQALFYNGYRYD